MKILIVSDIHGAVENIEALSQEIKKADAVICAGDFARFGATETALPTLEALCKLNETIFAVTGNCDENDFIEKLEEADVNIQGTMLYHDGLFFAGSGGSLKFTGVTPNERDEDDLISDFALVESSLEENLTQEDSNQAAESVWNNLILVSHQPPKDTKLDLVTGGVHVGSPLLRAYIEKRQPLLCICGHIHEAVSTDILGQTTLVNPGPLAEGHYAIAEVKKTSGKWEVSQLELKKI